MCPLPVCADQRARRQKMPPLKRDTLGRNFQEPYLSAAVACRQRRGAGGGIRTRMPPLGTPDFKSGASHHFRQLGGGRVAAYKPFQAYVDGIFFGALPT